MPQQVLHHTNLHASSRAWRFCFVCAKVNWLMPLPGSEENSIEQRIQKRFDDFILNNARRVPSFSSGPRQFGIETINNQFHRGDDESLVIG
ncbi:hypothetical protein J8I87_20360 [Paraburkholderia sp. LEh10]|uniref:hypothetical protein n=1 Tax=Paraburkholderia sp. LEh10 TaxID=2821353 RepID=UPI001AE9AF88|nr:hypothetical protein [Paraburkholderia sp. LEh10]MBP0592037.1 hypothetical protein [Paraburkholderia sp. LEh10]